MILRSPAIRSSCALVGGDVALVFNRQALLAVAVRPNVNLNRFVVNLYFNAIGAGIERNADDRCPAAIAIQYQQRLAVKLRAGRRRRTVAEIDESHPAGTA